jgi:hypothetical protein
VFCSPCLRVRIHFRASRKGQTVHVTFWFWRLLGLRGKSLDITCTRSRPAAAAIMAHTSRLELSLLSATMETFHAVWDLKSISSPYTIFARKWVSERGSFQFHMPTTGNVIFFLSLSLAAPHQCVMALKWVPWWQERNSEKFNLWEALCVGGDAVWFNYYLSCDLRQISERLLSQKGVGAAPGRCTVLAPHKSEWNYTMHFINKLNFKNSPCNQSLIINSFSPIATSLDI